jgi:hypothetical protein
LLRYLRNRARLRSVMSAFGGKADIIQAFSVTQSGHRRALAYRKLCGARAVGVSGLWNAETASIATRRLTRIAVPRSITVLVAAAIAILGTSAVGSPVITSLCKPMFMPGPIAFG